MRHASNDVCVVKLLVGFSAGGRQGLKEAQVNPGDFDGILAGAPAINWSNQLLTTAMASSPQQRRNGMAWHVAPAC
jgi:feruloyl esterase